MNETIYLPFGYIFVLVQPSEVESSGGRTSEQFNNYQKIEMLIKSLPLNRSPSPDGFICKLLQIFKDRLQLILSRLFQKAEETDILPVSMKKKLS